MTWYETAKLKPAPHHHFLLGFWINSYRCGICFYRHDGMWGTYVMNEISGGLELPVVPPDFWCVVEPPVKERNARS